MKRARGRAWPGLGSHRGRWLGASTLVAAAALAVSCGDNFGSGFEVLNDRLTCATGCTLDRAEAWCVEGRCRVALCEQNYGDCNFDPEDGCEVDLRADPDHCGRCANACPDGTCRQASCADPLRLWDGAATLASASFGLSGNRDRLRLRLIGPLEGTATDVDAVVTRVLEFPVPEAGVPDPTMVVDQEYELPGFASDVERSGAFVYFERQRPPRTTEEGVAVGPPTFEFLRTRLEDGAAVDVIREGSVTALVTLPDGAYWLEAAGDADRFLFRIARTDHALGAPRESLADLGPVRETFGTDGEALYWVEGVSAEGRWRRFDPATDEVRDAFSQGADEPGSRLAVLADDGAAWTLGRRPASGYEGVQRYDVYPYPPPEGAEPIWFREVASPVLGPAVAGHHLWLGILGSTVPGLQLVHVDLRSGKESLWAHLPSTVPSSLLRTTRWGLVWLQGDGFYGLPWPAD